MRSTVNLSRIVRAASCCGVERIIVCGQLRIDPKIARIDPQQLEFHRSLLPVLKRLKEEGHQLVGLEQTTHSEELYTAAFPYRTALVIGNERIGLDDSVLSVLDRVFEIPVYGLPYSHNVATATAMALYEYCRQFPDG
jgi:tRNA G18 (ribose-2'-O)-methylase SpoU